MIRKSFEIVNLFFVLLSIFVCFLKTGVSFLFLLTIGASYPFYMRFCSFWCKHCTLFLTKWNPHGTRLGKLAVFPDPNWLCAPGANIFAYSMQRRFRVFRVFALTDTPRHSAKPLLFPIQATLLTFLPVFESAAELK